MSCYSSHWLFIFLSHVLHVLWICLYQKKLPLGLVSPWSSLNWYTSVLFLYSLCFHWCDLTLGVHSECSQHPTLQSKAAKLHCSVQGWWPTFSFQAITYCTAFSHVKFLHRSLLCMWMGFGWWWWGVSCLVGWNTCATNSACPAVTTRTCLLWHTKLM